MELRRWSWVLAFAGSLAIAFGGAAYWLVQTWSGPPGYLLAFGVTCVVVYGVVERSSIQDVVSTPAFKFSGTSVLLQIVVALIAIVALVLAERSDRTFDLTTDRRHSLSDHARKVVGSLDEPVHVLAFFRGGSEAIFEPQVRLFEEASNGQLTVEWINPLANPLRAEMHGIDGEYGTVILQQGDRTKRLETDFDREQAFLEKLVGVQSIEDHRICWAIGHGEADPDDEYSKVGLGAIVIRLEGLNYQVTKSLIATEGIDRDCEALVVARPTVDWLPYEREAMAAYLAEGGAVLVLIDSQQVMSGPETFEFVFSAPDFVADLERFGVQVGDDIVLDADVRSTMMGVEDPSMVVIHGQGIVHHRITQSLSAVVNLFLARSVSPMEGVEGLLVQSLLRTSSDSWAETEPNSQIEPDEGYELIGEVSVAVVSEIANPDVLKIVLPEPRADLGPFSAEVLEVNDDVGRAVPADFSPQAGGRLVVIGDANFADNTMMKRGNNADLFLNALAWMVAEEDQIGERAPMAETLDVSALGAGVLCLVSLGGVPGVAILFAAFTLLRRRFL